MARAVILFNLLLANLLLAQQPAQAQSKFTTSTAIWPELQATYGAGEKGLFFFRNQYRINTDSRFNDFKESGLLRNFERIQFALGYEHTLSNHWQGGIGWRYAAENYPKSSFYSLFLRHAGKLKGLYFNKQVLLEYVSQEDQHASARTHLLGELGKQFQLRQRQFSAAISYQASLFSKLREQTASPDERFIDRTRLRLNFTYEAGPKFHITPYLMRQTDYYYVEVAPVYDEDDILVKEGYRTKRNRITPVIGLELKYHINKQASPASITY